ncbi:MAG: hypothetical protein KAS93_03440 [Gammaproteobacteria bacterium]|nr:hypothetical protein [Gammaproteobacteria bacterium]
MNKRVLTYIYITIATLGRLIPHPANLTPTINLSLFAGKQLSKGMAITVTLIALLLSDIALAYFYNYPVFGYWTLFSYSALAIIALVGTRINGLKNRSNLLFYVLFSSLGYWIWTNFGAWLLTPAYTKDAAGLATCYTAALPFLRNAMLGDLAWMVVIFGSYEWIQKLNRVYVK